MRLETGKRDTDTEPLANLSSPTATHREETAQEKIIKEAGGIVVVPSGVEVPPVPEKYSIEFLQSKHPVRGGSIASHVILGYDLESGQWICIDRGSGGVGDIFPGSLGLRGQEQDRIIAGKEVKGVRLTSPDDYRPVKRILDEAITQHRNEGRSDEDLPFYCIWGRTADTEHAAAGCRVLLGISLGPKASMFDKESAGADESVGLLAVWE